VGEPAPIVIGTSIAPKEIEKQRAAVDSWRALGFEVLSLNIDAEIATLQPQFPDVRFVPASRSAQERAGRPLVYFDDLLAALADTGRPVVGIVNSDIMMRATPALAGFLSREAAGAFVFGHRIDLETADADNGAPYEGGYDFFFFDRAVIEAYPKTNFAIGLPWWDYWAPAVPALNAVPLKRLVTPFAYHTRHDINWDSANWLYYASIFARYLTLGLDQAIARLGAKSGSDPDFRWMHFVAGLWSQLYRDRVEQYQLTQQIVAQGTDAERARFRDDIGAAEFLLVKHYGNLAESSCAFLKAIAADVEWSPPQAGST
jgi:hypothetical protein